MAELYEHMFRRFLDKPGDLEEEVANDVSIRETDLKSECVRQPSLYIKWSSLVAIAYTEYKKRKRHYERTWAWGATQARNYYADSEIKATEGRIEERVRQTPEVATTEDDLTQYAHILDIMKKCQEALWQKRDMLKLLMMRTGAEGSNKVDVSPDLDEWAGKALEKKTQDIPQDPDFDDLERIARSAIQKGK